MTEEETMDFLKKYKEIGKEGRENLKKMFSKMDEIIEKESSRAGNTEV